MRTIRTQRMLITLIAVVAALMAVVMMMGPSKGQTTDTTAVPPDTTPQPTTPPGDTCTHVVHYFANDVTGHKFGTPVPETTPEAAVAELHSRRCADPMLVVGHTEYQNRKAQPYGSVATRLAETVRLASDSAPWRTALDKLEAREKTATSVTLVEMDDSYKTLAAIPGDVPQMYVSKPGSLRFIVLRFTYQDGTHDDYKLSCGFQPVDVKFPGIPQTPPPPANTVPPNTAPPATKPPTVNTVPKVTQPTAPPATPAPQAAPTTTIPAPTTTTIGSVNTNPSLPTIVRVCTPPQIGNYPDCHDAPTTTTPATTAKPTTTLAPTTLAPTTTLPVSTTIGGKVKPTSVDNNPVLPTTVRQLPASTTTPPPVTGPPATIPPPATTKAPSVTAPGEAAPPPTLAHPVVTEAPVAATAPPGATAPPP